MRVKREFQQLRKLLLCPRRDDALSSSATALDNLDCMSQKCHECKDLKRLFDGPSSLCAQETRDHGGGED